MEYGEYIKLIQKRAESHLIDKDKDEALKAILEVSRGLYMGLHGGNIRRLTVRSLKGILSTLPEKPTEQDIYKAIHLIEGVILTILSCIFKEGEIMIVKQDKDDRGLKNNDQN